ncbi:MAG TPA: SpoIIE family protein phosphatase [Anaerolineales bacterium]|nr:SpoIIE family protein phosphatase [Anaerolineales bacterium]
MPIVEAQVAVAKVAKYATSVSGDTLEMIERPSGGLSFVLVDGQLSGRSAKAIANVVVRKAVSLLADGVRDGAAARAASDYLYTHRSGKVLASLNIISFDLQSQSLVITRNNPVPILVLRRGAVHRLEARVDAVGSRRDVRPEITEFPLEPGLAVIAYTDGLAHAGSRKGQVLDVAEVVVEMAALEPWDPQRWADELLGRAVALDDGRPADDISVLVGVVMPRRPDDSRRLFVRMPL